MLTKELDNGEKASLIASDKVEGTAVFNIFHKKIGHIHNLMVNAQSGQVEYAVLSFGGFLGLGEDHFPIPWARLKYDEINHGFVIAIDQQDLLDAPKHAHGTSPLFDPAYSGLINGYYGTGI